MTESCPKKTNIAEISPHLICALCGGYLIDATTIVECLHSFCKTCIVRYLESSKYCPICEVLVHKTRPLQNIRLDHTLQDIVYKLVPNLFKKEMKRRRDFYKDHPTIRSAKVRQEQQRHRFIYSADEQFSISLEFCPDGCIRRPSSRRSRKRSKQEPPERRYFLCPAGTTIGLLKKFMKLKFALDGKYQVDIFHEKGRLKNHYSLMDVAYIYSWKREGVLQLYYSVFNLPEPLPTITITEVKPEKCQEVTDDTGQRLEDTRPSTLFNKATLLGNHSVDRNIPHDLSPLQLIATVASDICIQEGRGMKRKPDESELYEKEEDTNNSTEANQLQKSIERAIDLCSNSNQGSPARAVVTNSVATSSIVVNTSSSVSTISGVLQCPSGAIQNSSGASLVSTKSELKTTDMKKTIDVSNGKVSIVLTSSSEKKVNVFKEKPKKTDTASQCDPRPKKHKGDGNHSKSKSHNNNKDNTKATTSVSKTDRIAISETKLSTKSDSSLKSNGVSIIEQSVSSVPTTQNSQSKPSETSGKIPTSVATTTTNITTTKDQAKDLPKASSDSHRESSSVCKVPSTLSSSSLPLSASSSVSKSNSSSVRQSGSSSSSKSLTSSSSAKSSNNNSIKTPSSTSSKSSASVQPLKSSVAQSKSSMVQPKSSLAPTKSSVAQPKVWSGMSHSQNTQVSNTDKTVGGQITNKVLSYSPKLPATSLPKATNSTSKTNDVVKSSTLVNGHGNTGEISKQQSKNSSSVKVKTTSDSKE